MTFEMALCLCPPDEGDERSHVESCKNTGWWSSSSAVIDWDRAEDEIDKCFDRATYPNPNYQLKFGELVVSVKMSIYVHQTTSVRFTLLALFVHASIHTQLDALRTAWCVLRCISTYSRSQTSVSPCVGVSRRCGALSLLH